MKKAITLLSVPFLLIGFCAGFVWWGLSAGWMGANALFMKHF